MIVNTVVNTDPAHAFEVFTGAIDKWWKRTSRHMWRFDTKATIRFEGDRLLEVHPDQTFVMGEVSVWEPGSRLIFSWLSPRPADAPRRTEVEVRFEELDGRTRIVLEHRGIAGMEIGDTVSSVVGLWWSDLLVAFGSQLTVRDDGRGRPVPPSR
jgi:hypothetical protein